jgi:hypothetical protein
MADTPQPDKLSVLDFMFVRAPSSIDAETMRTRYITDDDLAASRVAELVFDKVFCGPDLGNEVEQQQDLRNALLAFLARREIVCDNGNGQSRRNDRNARREILDFVDEMNNSGSNGTAALVLGELEQHAYLDVGRAYYLLPDRLDLVDDLPWSKRIAEAAPVLADYLMRTSQAGLKKKLEEIFDSSPIEPLFLSQNERSPTLKQSLRALFDALYILYLFRRWTSVNFDEIIRALRTLHALEAFARGKADTKEELAVLLSATPIVHPIFARLFHYARPFNDIKPIGIGDLKVVKQWLVEYRAGEISGIHNVMKGETSERNHRHLEKTEDVFAFTSEQQEETTKDSQSTDRFEVKREAENVVKTDLSVNANLRAQYQYGPMVLVAVGAGFAYNRNDYQQNKAVQNFSREVINKAVSRVQTRTLQQRSVTKIFETEETNKHALTGGTQHTSGIYRWLDKVYKAQLYNYGKRMMFEFLVPEPASFLVESKLRAFEGTVDVPQPSSKPTFDTLNLGFKPSDIDENKFKELRTKYDLSQFTFPARTRTVALKDQEKNQTLLEASGMQSNRIWWSKDYECRLDAKGYEISNVLMTGSIYWGGSPGANPAWKDRNFFSIFVDGTVIHQYDFSNTAYKAMYIPNDDVTPDSGPYLIGGDAITLTLGFQNVKQYALELFAELTLSAKALSDWQADVYKAVVDVEQKKVDDVNREKQLAYDTRMADYRNRIGELRATVLNDLLQGGSDAANRGMINAELKRQCLALITKEFDADASDDFLTNLETIGGRTVNIELEKWRVNETTNGTTAGFQTVTETVELPAVMIAPAREKGRYVQFLEQAFEWHALSYLVYPYFWATPPKWIEMLDHTSDADPVLTEFLRAGYARVLVAVSPEYDDAVLHFLATREPWEGGPTPVIGDPLFVPLYEEVREAQDDRYNAVPEGEPWTFTLPTSLVYLEGSSTPLPTLPDDKP